ncbi:MAG TPA: ABC transporter permease, partial [Gammaproteobacteria bacterium]|nr:ABC transporter permease [Gammaproteobacteria bacterium]
MSREKPRRFWHRARLGLPSFGSVLQDLRYTTRTLRRNPGFTLLAVMILALGIGANTAIFSLLSAVVLRPLPFKAPDRLVVLWDDFTALGGPADVEPAPANYVDWKTRARSFEDIAAMEKKTYNLTGGGEPEKLTGIRATANLFSLLGMQPLLGRTFLPDDEGADASPVVVVSRSLWMQRYGGAPAIVGRTIVLDGLKRTVIGVVPDDFEFPSADAVVWVPASFSPQELSPRDSYFWYVVARLKSGVSLDQAQAEMTSIAKIIQREYGAA